MFQTLVYANDSLRAVNLCDLTTDAKLSGQVRVSNCTRVVSSPAPRDTLAMALDWVQNLLFRMSMSRQQILVMDLTSMAEAPIMNRTITTNGFNGQDIAVDPQNGLILWIDYDGHRSLLMRSGMDGRDIFVSKDRTRLICLSLICQLFLPTLDSAVGHMAGRTLDRYSSTTTLLGPAILYSWGLLMRLLGQRLQNDPSRKWSPIHNRVVRRGRVLGAGGQRWFMLSGQLYRRQHQKGLRIK